MVCERWLNDFSSFLLDMGPCPSGLTLDRIDNDGNYTPENCRWATKGEQYSNKRDNRLVRCGDVIGTLREWEKVCGFNKNTLRSRLDRGWDTLDAILVPTIQTGGRRRRVDASC